MTDNNDKTSPISTPEGRVSVGDVIHFTASKSAFGTVRPRGTTLVIDAAMIAASLNREGASWLDRIDTEGSVIARGPWPSGKPTWTRGDREWEQAREAGRLAAHAEPDPHERAAKLAKVREDFGAAKPTSFSQDYDPAHTPAARALANDLFAREQAGLRHIVKSS